MVCHFLPLHLEPPSPAMSVLVAMEDSSLSHSTHNDVQLHSTHSQPSGSVHSYNYIVLHRSIIT